MSDNSALLSSILYRNGIILINLLEFLGGSFLNLKNETVINFLIRCGCVWKYGLKCCCHLVTSLKLMPLIPWALITRLIVLCLELTLPQTTIFRCCSSRLKLRFSVTSDQNILYYTVDFQWMELSPNV